MSARPAAFESRQLLLIGLIVACALSRLVPHWPNFSPIEATALFAGAFFVDRRLAVLVPIAAMLLSDLVIGFHSGMFVVYACIAAIAWFGRGLRERHGVVRVAAFGLASAVFFFIVTNFFVWLGLSHPMYPRTLEGLVACYVAAVPFFQNQLAGVAFYSILLFGGWALLARRVPALRASAV